MKKSEGNLYRQQSMRSLAKIKMPTEPRVDSIIRLLTNNSQEKDSKTNNKSTFTLTQNPKASIQNKQLAHDTHKYRSNEQARQNDKDPIQLQKRIKILEDELKHKLSSHFILAKLLKTKTHGELTHIDLYLEFRRVEDQLESKQAQISMLQADREEIANALKKIQMQVQQNELNHIDNIKMLQKSVQTKEQEWKREKNKLLAKIDESQADKFLLSELKKKNHELMLKVNNANQSLQVQKAALELQRIKINDYNSTEIITLKNQVSQLKSEISSLKDFKEKLEIKNTELGTSLKQEKQKQRELEDKLKKEYQKQCQLYEEKYRQLQQQSERQRQKLQNQFLQAKQTLVSEYSDVITELTTQIQNLKQNKASHSDKITQLTTERQSLLNEISKMEEKLISMSGQLNICKYDRDEKASIIVKLKESVNQDKQKFNKTISDLESKLQKAFKEKESAIKEKENQERKVKQMERQLQEMKKQTQSSASLFTLNSKLHSQNYKSMGRLIELTHKLDFHLELPETPAEEQIGGVVAVLARRIQKAVADAQKIKRERADQLKQSKTKLRELTDLIVLCCKCLKDESIQALAHQLSSSNDSQIIQQITNLLSSYSFPEPQMTKDSLQSTHMYRADSHRKIHLKQSKYEYSDQGKENIDFGNNRDRHQRNTKELKELKELPREKRSNLSKMKSEIQRKYFRA